MRERCQAKAEAQIGASFDPAADLVWSLRGPRGLPWENRTGQGHLFRLPAGPGEFGSFLCVTGVSPFLQTGLSDREKCRLLGD